MGILSKLNEHTVDSFWETCPTFKLDKVFKEVYDKDKSKNKKYSSKWMWTIAYFVEKEDNMYKNLPEEERKLIIEEHFYGKKFKWEEYTKYIDYWIKLNLTELERQLADLENKLVERREYINRTPYNSNTADDIDKLIINTDKVFTLYQKLKLQLEAEKEIGRLQGGVTESMLESGELK